MEPIEWSDKYSVGVRELDEQHRQLFDLLGMLRQAILRGDDVDSLALILQGFIDYAVGHCTHEEHLLRRHGYADIEAHRMEHSHLLHMLSEFREDLRDGHNDLAERLHQFVMHWLESHVSHTDKRYSEFLNARGVS